MGRPLCLGTPRSTRLDGRQATLLPEGSVPIRCMRCGHQFDPAALDIAERRSCPRCGAAVPSAGDPTEPTSDMVERTLGKFRLLELVGQGGFGKVYRALDAELDREVAIK